MLRRAFISLLVISQVQGWLPESARALEPRDVQTFLTIALGQLVREPDPETGRIQVRWLKSPGENAVELLISEGLRDSQEKVRLASQAALLEILGQYPLHQGLQSRVVEIIQDSGKDLEWLAHWQRGVKLFRSLNTSESTSGIEAKQWLFDQWNQIGNLSYDLPRAHQIMKAAIALSVGFSPELLMRKALSAGMIGLLPVVFEFFVNESGKKSALAFILTRGALSPDLKIRREVLAWVESQEGATQLLGPQIALVKKWILLPIGMIHYVALDSEMKEFVASTCTAHVFE